MQSENPLIADFVKLMNSAAGTFAGMTREARESARARVKEAVGGLDFVAREEFDGTPLTALGTPTILYPMRNAVDYAVDALTAIIRNKETPS